MEQNEEVLIRVYQEKERKFKLEVDELKQKLHTVQQGEASLRKQLRQSDESRQQLQKSVQSLSEEKVGLQRKCSQIERDLQQLRARFMADPSPCESCRRNGTSNQQSIYENNGSTIVGNNGQTKPVPAPRILSKVSGGWD